MKNKEKLNKKDAEVIDFIQKMLNDIELAIIDDNLNGKDKAELYFFSGEQDPFAYKYIIRVFREFIERLKDQNIGDKFIIKFIAGSHLYSNNYKEGKKDISKIHPSIGFLQDCKENIEFNLLSERMPIHLAYSPNSSSFICETVHTELVDPYRWSVKNNNDYKYLIPNFFKLIIDKCEAKKLYFENDQLKSLNNTKITDVSSSNLNNFFKEIKFYRDIIKRRWLKLSDNNVLRKELKYIKEKTNLGLSGYFFNSKNIFSVYDKSVLQAQ